MDDSVGVPSVGVSVDTTAVRHDAAELRAHVDVLTTGLRPQLHPFSSAVSMLPAGTALSAAIKALGEAWEGADTALIARLADTADRIDGAMDAYEATDHGSAQGVRSVADEPGCPR